MLHLKLKGDAYYFGGSTGRERKRCFNNRVWTHKRDSKGIGQFGIFISYLNDERTSAHTLTNKKRPGTNAWGSLQVEKSDAVLLHCHVSHLSRGKNMNLCAYHILKAYFSYNHNSWPIHPNTYVIITCPQQYSHADSFALMHPGSQLSISEISTALEPKNFKLRT